uniref:WD domain-containing protein, G-beta repeat-containing protein n=1 Tax=Candidatus Kentrum sp. LFY TaxID=2126342 RepID=A0A450UP83_9GAMM|nr:MAG: WD domain-containing protein, G-beta repeat-containing protein [Candidatus Kentron sp. LFY]
MNITVAYFIPIADLEQLLAGHEDWVISIAVNSDGTWAASGSTDGTVKIWDIETGDCRATLEGHIAQVSSVAITTNDKLILSGSDDKSIRVWDAESGRQLGKLVGHTRVIESVGALPGGVRALSSGGGDDRTLRFWDLTSNECTEVIRCETHREDNISTSAVNPRGMETLSGHRSGLIRLWDRRDGELIGTLEGHSGPVHSVQITPDGRFAVSGSADKTVRLWDLRTGICLKTLEGHEDAVSSVAISRDGILIASTGWEDGTIRLWERKSGKCLQVIKDDKEPFQPISVAFTPDRQRMLVGMATALSREWYFIGEGYFINIYRLGPVNLEALGEELMNNPDGGKRARAAEKLAKVGKPSVKILIEALNHEHSGTRYYVATALGDIGDPRATLPLANALQAGKVGWEAAEALGKIGVPHKKAMKALCEAFQTSDPYDSDLRWVAKDAFLRLTEKTVSAKPYLKWMVREVLAKVIVSGLVVGALSETEGFTEGFSEILTRLLAELSDLLSTLPMLGEQDVDHKWKAVSDVLARIADLTIPTPVGQDIVRYSTVSDFLEEIATCSADITVGGALCALDEDSQIKGGDKIEKAVHRMEQLALKLYLLRKKMTPKVQEYLDERLADMDDDDDYHVRRCAEIIRTGDFSSLPRRMQ